MKRQFTVKFHAFVGDVGFGAFCFPHGAERVLNTGIGRNLTEILVNNSRNRRLCHLDVSAPKRYIHPSVKELLVEKRMAEHKVGHHDRCHDADHGDQCEIIIHRQLENDENAGNGSADDCARHCRHAADRQRRH